MMKKLIAHYILVLLLTVAFLKVNGAFPEASSQSEFEPVFQKGMSYRPAPYPNYYPYNSSESDESLRRMAETNVEWVAIIAWWFQENLTSTEIYPHLDYTPTNDSLKHAVQKAHELGMRVMLKPMIDTEDAVNQPRWMIPDSPGWFQSYKAFISAYAQFAQENNVDLFSIGCEFKYTENKTTSWRQIISEVRKYYLGPLSYAATIDSYQSITWWDSLGYVGIDAYFNLTNKNDPTLEELKQAWNPIANDIESWYNLVKKPILFTEIGYRSGDGANKQPWNWTETMKPDLQEQFDCYLAAFQTFWSKPWFYGFYWWIWEGYSYIGMPDYDTAYNQTITDFTPQNKPIQYLIKAWYASDPMYARVETLQNELTALRQDFSDLLEKFNSLNSSHQTLRQDFDDLVKLFNVHLSQYGTDRYLLYTLALATVTLTVVNTILIIKGRKQKK